MRRVVITGIGAVTPIGHNIPQYLEGLQKGISGACPITQYDATNFKTHFACEVQDFDVQDYFDRKEARKLDRFTQFAMISADEAIAMAGLEPEKLDLDRVGVIYASGIGGLKTLQDDIENFATGNGIPRFNPFMVPKMICDIAPGQISIKYGFRGINYSTVSACASSNHAIMNAFDYVRMGRNDIIITGGAEATITSSAMGGFSSMKALSTRNDDYKTASRPFDAERDGFVLGEGAGTIVLEELEHAKKRGATILGEIVGVAATADAYHITAPHPEGVSVIKVMNQALEDAKMNSDEIDYVNVHGTSTPLGDIAEVKAIMNVFGDHSYNLNISSTKSMTGHLLGGAGAVEGIAGILAINHKFVPPTINHFNDDPALDKKLNFTFNQAQDREVKAVISNTFGFGGHNASVIMRKFEN